MPLIGIPDGLGRPPRFRDELPTRLGALLGADREGKGRVAENLRALP